jgi:hypothetical protein
MGRSGKRETRESRHESPAAVENGGAFGRASWGQFHGGHGAGIANSSEPGDALPEAQNCPQKREQVGRGSRQGDFERAPREPRKSGPSSEVSGWLQGPDPELRLRS